MKKRSKFRNVVASIGARALIASLLVFLLTVAATCVASWQLLKSTKESIHLQGKVNAVESAKEFDNYLLVRKNTVILAGHVVDQMIRDKKPTGEILEYLTAESQSIKKSIDKDYTGLYGWINGEYCDGDGWVPDADYIPTERPWYLEAIADDSDITFVQPYLDEQTKTILTTLAERLSDGVSVIALDITLSRIQEITEEIARHTPGSYGIVLDKAGQVIAHSDNNELGKNYLEETGTLGAVLADRLFNGSEREFEVRFNGRHYMVFVEQIEGDWQAISLINTRTFYRPLIVITALSALFAVLEAIVLVTILYNQGAKNLAIASAKEAESANRAKSRFLSRMSHEIRTPINQILGLDSIALRDEHLTPGTRENLNKIGTSANHLLCIVNDILEMSRIESGHLELKEERFSFRDFLDQLSIIVSGQCEEKGLDFEFKRAESLNEYLVGDAPKLRQALINLLGNAVKFTDAPGTITFEVEQKPAQDGAVALRFTVKDTGIGMDPAYLPRLYDAFTQEDTDNTSRYGGSGLGTTITKRFVDLMGGDIQVETEKGRGTTFVVTVALKCADPADAPAPAEAGPRRSAGPALDGLHVLIAEDMELNAEVLSDLLEMEGMTSEWAENGQRAVELFAASPQGHFSAILMDMRMPVMDGMTATRAIRKLDRPDARRIPIIALTANAFDEDVKQCLQAGMNAHLAKPVDIELLKDLLGRTLEGT